jgi:hypothetical protein
VQYSLSYNNIALCTAAAAAVQDLAWVIMNEVTKLCYEVSEADVARARNQLKASLLFMQDSSQRK